jgi:hypothetical protein
VDITISKAMKKLKKLKNESSKISEKIDKHNRTLAGTEVLYSVPNLLDAHRRVMKDIIALKVNIMKANIESGNYERILEIGELKGLKSTLSCVDTNSGVDVHAMAYRNTPDNIEYQVQVDEKGMEALINNIEDEIESNLDVLDEFNAKTKI